MYESQNNNEKNDRVVVQRNQPIRLQKQSTEKCAATKTIMQNQTVNQERDKRDQEHQELYWFSLPQELHPIFLPASKEVPLKNQIVQSIHTLAPYKNTLLPPTRIHAHYAEPYYTSTSINSIHLQKTTL